MKLHFDQLFSNQGGYIKPKVKVQINGITMGTGVSFGSGITFGGVDLVTFVGKYLDVEVQNDVHIIKGVFD